jgi:hypothetical protein
MGYCEKGLECEHQHIRECPDFAETGKCDRKGCRLPHVIRANRNRKPATTTATSTATSTDDAPTLGFSVDTVPDSKHTAESSYIGDEFISLTFQESDSDSAPEQDESDEDDNEEDDEEEEDDEDVADHDL